MNLSVLKAERAIAEHRRKVEELGKLIAYGDWVKVAAKIPGMTKENCQMAFRRINSERHHEVAKMLEKVISERLEKFETTLS